MSNVAVKINNAIYSGWTEITVQKSIESMAGSFSIKGTFQKVIPFQEGASIQILLFDQPILKGYIDDIDLDQDRQSKSFSFVGRDASCDLVDCSAVTKTSQFLNITYKNLVNKLLEPFGLKAKFLSSNVDKQIKKVSIQQESVFEILEREARKVGVLVYSDFTGSIVIGDIGSGFSPTRLQMPGNVVKYKSRVRSSERYSEYKVVAQQSSSDNLTLEQQFKVSAKSKDSNIDRYRPLIIRGETGMTLDQAKKRAEWEAAVRAARSQEISCKVDSWLDSGSKLWDINTTVSVDIEPLGLQTDMLVKSATYVFNNDDGSVADLVLTHANSLLPQPIVPKKDKNEVLLPI